LEVEEELEVVAVVA
jgi:hypothetical protein